MQVSRRRAAGPPWTPAPATHCVALLFRESLALWKPGKLCLSGPSILSVPGNNVTDQVRAEPSEPPVWLGGWSFRRVAHLHFLAQAIQRESLAEPAPGVSFRVAVWHDTCLERNGQTEPSTGWQRKRAEPVCYRPAAGTGSQP